MLSTQIVSLPGATPVSVTLPSPQNHQQLIISPTVPLTGTNALHVVVVESR